VGAEDALWIPGKGEAGGSHIRQNAGRRPPMHRKASGVAIPRVLGERGYGNAVAAFARMRVGASPMHRKASGVAIPRVLGERGYGNAQNDQR
jgi:hypothetical protein